MNASEKKSTPAPFVDPAQAQLRETAGEFVRIRGALQNAGALAVVNASPATKSRLDALAKRAALIQETIEKMGRVVDGARRWFVDTFGTDVEETVPMANPAIGASIQASVAAMNYFLRDAKAELDRIVMQQKSYEAMSPEQKDVALNALHGEAAPPGGSLPEQSYLTVNNSRGKIKGKWVLLSLAAAAALWYFGGLENGESEA